MEYKIGKYEFPSHATYEVAKAKVTNKGRHKHTFVHVGCEQTKCRVDVLWATEDGKCEYMDFCAYHIDIEDEGMHEFAGHPYTENKINH